MTFSTFPYRLHHILEKISKKSSDKSSIISWSPTGRTFRIHDRDAFKTYILPKYFPKQSQYKSFRRQLQYYGFYTLGRNHFGHLLFARHQEHLLVNMKHKKGQSGNDQNSVDSDLSLAWLLGSAPLKHQLPTPQLREDDRIIVSSNILPFPSSRIESMIQQRHQTASSSSSSGSEISSFLRGAQLKSTAGRHQFSHHVLATPFEEKARQIQQQLDRDLLALALRQQQRAEALSSSLIGNEPKMDHQRSFLMSGQPISSAFIDLARIQLGL